MLLRVARKAYRSAFFLFITVPFLLTTSQGRALDFTTQSENITRWQSLADQVLDDYGSYSHHLVEPYTQLARAQLGA